MNIHVANAQKEFQIAVWPGAEKYQPVIGAVYKEMNMSVKFVQFPTERSLRAVNIGSIDADIVRSEKVVEMYDHLIGTKKEIMTFHLVAYVKKGSPIKINKPSDIAKYKVGLINGTKIAEEFTKQHSIQALVVNDPPSLIQILETKRVDIVLIASIQSTDKLKHIGTELKPYLLETKMVHILNKNHQDIANKFDLAFSHLFKTKPEFKQLVEDLRPR